MAGFYFIFMFGVPAIALAMYSAAKPENKSKVAGMMFSIAFTAFLTGITEPVEFTFMFLAPVLYAFHAVMTGIALAVANMFGILHGFGFSAGLIDYVLNYGLATKPILIIPIGLVFGIIYFIVSDGQSFTSTFQLLVVLKMNLTTKLLKMLTQMN